MARALDRWELLRRGATTQYDGMPMSTPGFRASSEEMHHGGGHSRCHSIEIESERRKYLCQDCRADEYGNLAYWLGGFKIFHLFSACERSDQIFIIDIMMMMIILYILSF